MFINFHRVFPNLLCRLGCAARCHSSRDHFLLQGRSKNERFCEGKTAVLPDTKKKEPWAVHPFVSSETAPHTAEELFLIENILEHCESGAVPHWQAQSYLEK